ncbi:MAG: hypothetical protein H6746_08960 [Deltaproteobacteria bacterium]|nr:hypothetical protein [Deltaproteobacteria bacterium]
MRLGVGAGIVLSLLPIAWTPWANGAFLALFAVELTLRCLAFRMPRLPDEPADHPRWLVLGRRASFLLLDAAALASFLPGMFGLPGARWLRLFRLARLVLLIRYWSTLIGDLRAVLLRRERARKVALMGGVVALVSFCGTVLLDHLTADHVDFDGDGVATAHDGHFFVRLWWAFRQIQDPGNMLTDPSDLAVVAVSLGLTVFGLFLVSFLIGLGTDVVREVIDIASNRPAGMTGHTIVVGVNPATRPLLHELMAHYHKSAMRPHFAVIGESEARPHFLDDPTMSRVVYRHGHPGEEGYLHRVDVTRSKRVLLLADPRSANPDAATLGLILSVRSGGTPTEVPRVARIMVVAEVLDPANLGAARVAGGEHTVTVPSEQLIGLFVGAVARQPHLARLLVELLTSRGHEVYSYLFGLEILDALPQPAQWPDFETLARFAGLASSAPCVPIAWLTSVDGAATSALVSPEVHLAPAPGPAPPHTVGFLAVSPSFRATREVAARVARGLAPSPPSAPWTEATAAVDAQPEATLERVLVCGFRAATFDLCEALMLAHPGVEVTLLLGDETTLAHFTERLAEREVVAARSTSAVTTGVFRPHPDGGFVFAPDDGAPACGRLTVHAGDWTSERVLTRLPVSGAHVRTMDAVIYLAAPAPRSDGQTALSVLKLAELQAGDGGFRPGFRVVAAVTETSLRRQLQVRYRDRVGAQAQIAVFSSQELRAWFAFQAAAVPGFHALYDELLRPGGAALRRHRLRPERLPADCQSFPELGRALRAEGRLLIAVESPSAPGRDSAFHVAPAPGEPGYDLRQVDAAWVIERDAPLSGARSASPEAPEARPA